MNEKFFLPLTLTICAIIFFAWQQFFYAPLQREILNTELARVGKIALKRIETRRAWTRAAADHVAGCDVRRAKRLSFCYFFFDADKEKVDPIHKRNHEPKAIYQQILEILMTELETRRLRELERSIVELKARHENF